MLRKITHAALWLFLLFPTVLFAHADETATPTATKMDVNAGPYNLTVEFNEYPINALKSLEMKVTPEEDFEQLTAQYNLIPPSADGKQISGDLNPYPGLDGAWLLYVKGIPEPGHWTWEIEVNGPDGKGTAYIKDFEVTDPPGIPLWLGWLIGLIPLYGLVAFAGFEYRRVKRIAKSNSFAQKSL
ncbi:hypothetical protein [Paenibacillus beijingensis]|nr:hypothetical protein [Paenibacillus beijingensis]